jgi:hypothetical protein
MATQALGYAPGDPIGLVESCYRAIEWILATHTAKGVLIPRPWVDAIDRAIEADQKAEVQALEASSAARAR